MRVSRSEAKGGVGSALLLGRSRGEVWVLVRDPIDEFTHISVRQQALHIDPVTLQFRIAEIGDQCLLANGVHWHHVAAASALRNGVMPDNCLASGPATKPANHNRRWTRVPGMQISVRTMF